MHELGMTNGLAAGSAPEALRITSDAPSVAPKTSTPVLTIPAVATPRRPRKDLRKPVLSQARLKVLDGLSAGNEYEIQTRDSSLTGVTFLLKDLLAVGQFCELAVPTSGRIVRRQCEVIRSRQLSNGRYEMSIQYRGPEILPPQQPTGKRRRRR